jgi:hypothetical protein
MKIDPEDMDPGYTRWKRKYPKFPGVAECVDLLRRRNVKGGFLEAICGALQENTAAHAHELVVAFRSEADERVRCILLGIIAEARLPEALPALVESLRSPDESLRFWAVTGLRDLNTPETRRALWEAGLSGR